MKKAERREFWARLGLERHRNCWLTMRERVQGGVVVVVVVVVSEALCQRRPSCVTWQWVTYMISKSWFLAAPPLGSLCLLKSQLLLGYLWCIWCCIPADPAFGTQSSPNTYWPPFPFQSLMQTLLWSVQTHWFAADQDHSLTSSSTPVSGSKRDNILKAELWQCSHRAVTVWSFIYVSPAPWER